MIFINLHNFYDRNIETVANILFFYLVLPENPVNSINRNNIMKGIKFMKVFSTPLSLLFSILIFTLILISDARADSLSNNISNENFTVIAHRGACGYLPEHTLEAKALAHGMNPDFIEQDVALTKDNVPIVIHDHFLDTVTNVSKVYEKRKRTDGRYYAIDFTWKEICNLTVHERIDIKTGDPVFSDRFPVKNQRTLPLKTNKTTKYSLLKAPSPRAPAFKIPSLEEEIIFIQGLNKSRNKNIGLYVELKAPWFHRNEGKDIASVVLKLLSKYGYSTKNDKIIIQCFDPLCLKTMKYIHKTQIPLVQLIADNSWHETPGIDYEKMLTNKGLQKISRYANGVGPWISQLVEKDKLGSLNISDVVKNAHKNKLIVHPYTARKDSLPDNFKSMKELLNTLYYKVKVDGIFSDFPDTAVDFRNTLSKHRK